MAVEWTKTPLPSTDAEAFSLSCSSYTLRRSRVDTYVHIGPDDGGLRIESEDRIFARAASGVDMTPPKTGAQHVSGPKANTTMMPGLKLLRKKAPNGGRAQTKKRRRGEEESEGDTLDALNNSTSRTQSSRSLSTPSSTNVEIAPSDEIQPQAVSPSIRKGRARNSATPNTKAASSKRTRRKRDPVLDDEEETSSPSSDESEIDVDTLKVDSTSKQPRRSARLRETSTTTAPRASTKRGKTAEQVNSDDSGDSDFAI